MIDRETFFSEVPSQHVYLSSSPKLVVKTNESGGQVFSDDQCLICDDEIQGFAFNTKQWCIFFVDWVEDIKFNSDAFSRMILPEAQKEIIQSLVEVHVSQKLEFDDMIKGKGKGMIFLLHGVPGVGKTLTAGT
jgi:hypothetical protein